MFTPIRTQRLLIRPFRAGDAEGLYARRNDPEVAKYQNWPLPFTKERAKQIVAELTDMDGPTNDDWWMAAVCDPESGEVFGDLAVHLSSEGRTAEVGYAFATAQWGRGYAVEALEALVAHLFDGLS